MPDNRSTVLQLIGSFAQGGSERQAVQLTRLLAEDGRWRVLVACLDPHGVLRPEVERLELGPIPSFPLTSFYHPTSFVQWMRFARYLRRNNVRIVQTHDFYTNVFGIPGAMLAGVPIRIAARRETNGFRTAAQLKAERAVYRLSHAIVANAQAVREQLISEGVPGRKIVTIYNGIDLGRMARTVSAGREEILAQLGVTAAADRRFVTIVANLRHEVKDYPTFLRAARVVHTAMPQAVFLIAGEGRLIDPMRSLAGELGIKGSVAFLGRCERVADLLSVSDVCVLASRSGEGFSNAILEYMAASRPVVATDVGGAREAVTHGETGFVVAPGDVEGIAARILYLLRHPEEAAGMGERGRREVEARFSCAAQLRNTLGLYDALLAGHSLAPERVPGAEK